MNTAVHEELKDLRAEVRVLRADNETLRGMVERLSTESSNHRSALDEALRLLVIYGGLDHCSRIRAIAEGRA
jgi:hypothetical protein